MKKNYVTLGELATYVNGYAFKPTDWSDEGLEIIRIQNLTGNLSEVNLYSGEYNKKYEVNNGDVLISWSASLGVYVWNKGRAILNQHIFKVVFNKVDVDKEFFIQQVGYILGRANVHAHGATMKHLTRPVFDSLKFYFPSREEQKDISNKLCIVDRLIELHEKYVKDLEQLVKSRFIEMFGDPNINPYHWPMVKNGFVIKSCESGWSGNGVQRARKSGEIAVLKVSAVTKGYFISDECKVLDNQEQIKKYVFPEKGDLLFSRANTREMVGATAIIYNDYPELILPDKLWKLKFIDIVNVVYMKHVLSCNHIRSQFSLISNGTSGSMYNVSMSKFKEIDIPLPPIDLQNKFADFVHQTEKSKFTHCYELLLLIIKKIWYNNYV